MEETKVSVDGKELRKVAEWARLEVSTEELPALEGYFKGVLGFLDRLKTVDTTGVSPTARVLKLTNRFREDQTKPSLSQEEALANAPSVKDGCFKVPLIME